MPVHLRHPVKHPRRSAFTFLELILAAAITALVATAGTTLIFAITNAATQTRNLRSTKAAGDYALFRFARAVRSARAVGNVTPTTITLWVDDKNGNDGLNLNELAYILYDAGEKQIGYRTMESSTNTTEVAAWQFTNFDSLRSLMDNASPQNVIWAYGVETFALDGHPANTDARIVQLQLTIGTGGEEAAFQTSASPRASADYLFNVEARAPPLPGSTRIRRKYYSRWDGYADLMGG